MKEEILKLRKDGLTYNEICKKLGCVKSTVSYHCKKEKLGVEPKNKKEKMSEWGIGEEIENKVLELRNEKYKYEEIYDELKDVVTKEKIRIICSLNNLNSVSNKPTEEEILEFQRLYDEGTSIRKIAKISPYSRMNISKYLIKKNVKSELEIKKSKSKSVVDWRKRVKIKLVEYKGGECKYCGYNKSIKALEFHHLDPNEKDFTISGKSWSFKRLKKEADKCILVCNRCHVEIHDGLIEI